MMGAVLGLAARQPRRRAPFADGEFARALERSVIARYIAGVGPAPAGLRGLASRASRLELDAALERLDGQRAALVRGLFPEPGQSAAGPEPGASARWDLIGRRGPFKGPRS